MLKCIAKTVMDVITKHLHSVKLKTGKLNIPPGKAFPGAVVSHTLYNCGRCISFPKRKGQETIHRNYTWKMVSTKQSKTEPNKLDHLK
jgi:hypothetical protein